MNKSQPRAAFAITSDGVILVDVDQFPGIADSAILVSPTHRKGGAVFVGVPVTQDELAEVLHRLDDALAEAAARLVATRQRRRRGRVRKNARSES